MNGALSIPVSFFAGTEKEEEREKRAETNGTSTLFMTTTSTTTTTTSFPPPSGFVQKPQAWFPLLKSFSDGPFISSEKPRRKKKMNKAHHHHHHHFPSLLKKKQPSYLPATRISAGPPPPAAASSSSNASSALECFKRCAVALSASNASLSCYGATFAPATTSCALFSAITAPCPALVLEVDPTASSALFPSRYSKLAESCITAGPGFKDGPPFEVPSLQEGADAAAGIATEGISAAVVQGATIFDSAFTTLSYIGTVSNMVSPAVCTGLCRRYKRGSEWKAQPTDFGGTWAAAAGVHRRPRGASNLRLRGQLALRRGGGLPGD